MKTEKTIQQQQEAMVKRIKSELHFCPMSVLIEGKSIKIKYNYFGCSKAEHLSALLYGTNCLWFINGCCSRTGAIEIIIHNFHKTKN